MKSNIVLFIGLSIILSGCASLSKTECQVADWYAIGYKDGKNGMGLDYILQHNKACSRVQITPDKTLWEQGRQQGLKQYCIVERAYAQGSQNQNFNYLLCPAEQQFALRQHHQRGKEVYLALNQIEKDKKQLELYKEQHQRLRDGENLEFKTEKEARAYLLSLPEKIQQIEQRLIHNRRVLQQLQN